MPAASILAHQQQRLTFDDETKSFTFDDVGPWVVQSLDYFESQTIFSISDPIESIKKTLELGLVSVPDGTVAEFLACPATRIVQPLYEAIWQHTKGN